MTLAVVMCSYNGAAYIGEQLRSIEQQTSPPDKLMIYDWGSQDGTVDEISAFLQNTKLNAQLQQLGEASGVYISFKRAMKHLLQQYPDVSYIALCDQDDIWEPDKLEIARKSIAEVKSPSFFFSDVSLVNADGGIISRSRLADSFYFSSRPYQLNYALFLANPVVGMTLVLSREIAEQFILLPDDHQFMHDWSMLLCALLLGSKVCYSEKTLVRYRQHDSNILGAASEKSKLRLFLEMFKRVYRLRSQYDLFRQLYPQQLHYPFFSVNMLSNTLRANFLRIHYRLALIIFLLWGVLKEKLIRKKSAADNNHY
ncbi:glycosyltransferase [Endozoicomonas sp. YOMI1]|uniref:glycosyltransferase n=1 Tax=Endozoicomonas sp. YOMI1 TaxID=2828739 RepID=UPI0021474D26|nr:glycosyltransferase [Endozoicomonas sp. YOMI1]